MQTGILCGLLAGAFWGLVFIAPRLLPSFSPLELVVGRYGAYGVIAIAVAIPQMRGAWRRIERTDLRAMLRQALAGNIVYYLLLAYGVQHAGVSATSLIIGVLPVVVTLMGRRDHGAVSLRTLAPALGLVVLGIVCINIDVFTHGASHTGGGEAFPVTALQRGLGVICAAGALICWSWYAVDNARYLKANSKFSSGQWATLYGLTSGAICVVIAIAMFATDSWSGMKAIAADGQTGSASLPVDWTRFWMVNIAVSVGASLIGNHLWNIASRSVPVTLSGQLIVFETLFALLYGFVFDQRMPRALEWAAIALLMVGVAWAVRKHAAVEHTPLPTPPTA